MEADNADNILVSLTLPESVENEVHLLIRVFPMRLVFYQQSVVLKWPV